MNPRQRLWWKNRPRAANASVVATPTSQSIEETTTNVVAETKKVVANETPLTTTKKVTKTGTTSKTSKKTNRTRK